MSAAPAPMPRPHGGPLGARSVLLLRSLRLLERFGPMFIVARHSGGYALVTGTPDGPGLVRVDSYSFKTIEALSRAGLAAYSQPMVAPPYEDRDPDDSGRAWAYRLTDVGLSRGELDDLVAAGDLDKARETYEASSRRTRLLLSWDQLSDRERAGWVAWARRARFARAAKAGR